MIISSPGERVGRPPLTLMLAGRSFVKSKLKVSAKGVPVILRLVMLESRTLIVLESTGMMPGPEPSERGGIALS